MIDNLYTIHSVVEGFIGYSKLSLSYISTSWRSILILSSHLCLGLPSGLFPLGFPIKTLYTPLLSTTRASWSAHLILLDFINRTVLCEEYRSLSPSLCSFFHFPVTSPHLDPNILLNILFSNTLSLLFSLNVSDIIYIYIYYFLTQIHE